MYSPHVSSLQGEKPEEKGEGLERRGREGGVCLDPGQPSRRGKPGAQEVGMHTVMQLCQGKERKDSEYLEALVLKAPVYPSPLPISVAVSEKTGAC